MNAELEHIWSRVTDGLAEAVEEPVFRIWLGPLSPLELEGSKLTVAAPPQTCAWVRERFGRALQAAVAAVLGPEATVDVVAISGGPASDSRTDRHAPRERSQSAALIEPAAALNPKLTFGQFVIGDSNRLAHAAALTVGEMPAQAYNPLFICGPPGVGKTHLLRSIEAYILAHSPGLQVRSTTGEAFTNEFRQALTSSRIDAFKAGFRHVDVLLIDDVQFLERKAKTEEEFFHTFNALYEAGSQIVLSSDRPPRDLQALEDRLRERFQSGLVADIRAPDLSTRMAILRKRAQHDGVQDVDQLTLETIARRISVNVRALEGALIRVVAYSSLTGRRLNAELAREVLDGLYPQTPPRERSLSEIKAVVSAQYGITADELISPARGARVSLPRQLAMYLARELTDESLPSIGRAFGGRDHTTVLHALRRAKQRIATDPTYRTSAHTLLALLSDGAADRSA
ncbi:MAG TPA: chromosomal replication initiator protein DnaA [Solirubrobacteraceae bacterium]|nr:chromosomal replication initiator protein DnaA [Solirubrobacteraceae bacterium]